MTTDNSHKINYRPSIGKYSPAQYAENGSLASEGFTQETPCTHYSHK